MVSAGVYRFRLRALRREYDAVRPLWFGHHSDAYTTAGIGHNLLWVTLGNTLSGVVFMGLGYWYATPKSERPAPAKSISQRLLPIIKG